MNERCLLARGERCARCECGIVNPREIKRPENCLGFHGATAGNLKGKPRAGGIIHYWVSELISILHFNTFLSKQIYFMKHTTRYRVGLGC